MGEDPPTLLASEGFWSRVGKGALIGMVVGVLLVAVLSIAAHMAQRMTDGMSNIHFAWWILGLGLPWSLALNVYGLAINVTILGALVAWVRVVLDEARAHAGQSRNEPPQR